MCIPQINPDSVYRKPALAAKPPETCILVELYSPCYSIKLVSCSRNLEFLTVPTAYLPENESYTGLCTPMKRLQAETEVIEHLLPPTLCAVLCVFLNPSILCGG